MHVPVITKEVIEYLGPKSNENFIDCTAGHGGHTKKILEKTGPNGKVLGIDQDPEQIKICEEEIKDFKKRIILINSSYTNLKEIVKENNFKKVYGVLLDLGMSSWHLEKSGRGFSFLKDEPLDMRYGAECQNFLTAKKIVNEYSEEEIEKILREYGEERFARNIGREIIAARRKELIETTFQLVEIIKKAVPLRFQHDRIHIATRTFQALRIAVNQELENLKSILPQAMDILEPRGRLVVISFHSLEDRIVKNFFRERAKEETLKILTKKPITPSFEEIKLNPRSRSAKLRAAVKII